MLLSMNNFINGMKRTLLIISALILSAALVAGCTSQPSQTPAPVPANTNAVVETSAPAVPSAPSLAGTSWKLGWYDDTKGVWSSVVQGSTITAAFTSDGKITGSNGCTQYTTEYTLLAAPGIWIRRPAVPETTCSAPLGVNSQQSAYYTDLMNAATYTFSGSELQMHDKPGKKILQFEPMS